METYAKLFSSITDSTVWCEPNETRILWITMLAMSDKTGYVGASVPGLASRAKISIEGTRAALAKFLAPDPDSRSDDYEGRRIEVADRGWVLLNYERFRDMRDEEERRIYERDRKRRQRSAKNVRDNAGQSPEVPQSPALSAHAYAQAQAQADTEEEKKEETRAARSDIEGLDVEVWNRFQKYRKQIKKPIKPASLEAAQRKLAQYGSDQAAVVEQTIANGWTGTFDLEKHGNGKQLPRDTRNSNERAIDELLGR